MAAGIERAAGEAGTPIAGWGWRRVAGVVLSLTCSLPGVVLVSTPTVAASPAAMGGLPVQNIYDYVTPYPELEAEARVAIAAIHGVPNDNRIAYWARDEIRAYVLGKLIEIAQKPAAQRSASQQASLAKLQDAVRVQRTAIAQKALDLYHRWQTDPCHFTPPAGFTYNPDPSSCIADSFGNLVTTPISPTAPEFTAFASDLVLAPQLGDPSSVRSMRLAAFGFAMLGAAAVAGVLAAVAASVSAVSAAIVAAVGSFALVPVFTPGVAAIAGAAAATAVIPGAAAFVAAASVAAVVGFVILAVAGSVIQGLNVFDNAAVPGDLQKLLDAAQQTPDIAAAASSTMAFQSVWSTFVVQTLPDYRDQIVANEPVGASVPGVDMQWRTAPEAAPSNVTTAGQIRVRTWSDDATQPNGYELVSFHDGWFVRQAPGQPPFYSLVLPYVDWSGFKQLAGITPTGFLITTPAQDGATSAVTGCAAGHPDCNAPRPTLPVVTPTGPGGADEHTLAGPTLRPIASIAGVGAATVGTPFAVHATGVDLTTKGTPTFTWSVPNPRGGAWTATGADALMTVRLAGPTVLTLTATASNGQSTTVTVPIDVADVAPTLSDIAPTPDVVTGGVPVTLVGTVSHPGDETIVLTIDWGDGSPPETHGLPCDPAGLQICPTVVDPATGQQIQLQHLTGPTQFTYQHKMRNSSLLGLPLTISVTATDSRGTSTTQVMRVVSVDSLPSVILNPAAVPGVTFFPYGGDERTVPVGTPMTVRFRVIDPDDDAGTVHFDWGDGTIDVIPYTCSLTCAQTVGTACPPGQFSCGGFAAMATHTYTTAGTRTLGVAAVDVHGGVGTATATATALAKAQTISITPLSDTTFSHVLVLLMPSSTSGLPVSIATTGSCSVTSGVLNPTGAGSCTVTASQAGDGSWAPAADVVQTFQIAPVTLQVAGPQISVPAGQPIPALTPIITGFASPDTTAIVTSSPVCQTTATSASRPGTYDVTCSGGTAPSGYTFAAPTVGQVVVTKAGSSTSVVVAGSTARATVAAAPTGAQSPSGTVTFRVGTRVLGTAAVGAGGVATLGTPLPDGPLVVTADYAGDTSFAPSNGAYTRAAPNIAASVSGTPNAVGWYKVRPIVSFTCTSPSAPLIAACPGPVTVGEGWRQSVTRRIVTTDGGTASTTVGPLSVDTTAPILLLLGVSDGGRYSSMPRPACWVLDLLSGLKSCTVTLTKLADATAPLWREQWRYVAVATDNADNTRTATGTFWVKRPARG